MNEMQPENSAAQTQSSTRKSQTQTMRNSENTPDYEAILDEMPEPTEEDLDKAMDDFIASVHISKMANTAPQSDNTTAAEAAEDGIVILENGKRFDPSQHVLRPGYLEVDDELMVVRKLGDNPERYDSETKQWVHYPNTAEAAIHSRRLTEQEAHKLAKKQGIPLD